MRVIVVAALRSAACGTSTPLIDRRDDWVADDLDLLELLLIVLILGALVVVEPLQSFLHGGLNLLLLLLLALELVDELVLVVDSVLHVENVGLELVAGVNLLLHLLVFHCEFFRM